MNSMTNTSKDYSIELLRFLAATCVVFVHIPIVGVGSFGVDIFFAISGFVMMLSTEGSSENFFLKRIIRIVPTYYIFTLAVFSIAMVAPSVLNNTTADFSQLVHSLLFVPFDKNGVGHYPILFLGWTLNYEMYFYLLFALALMFSPNHKDIAVTVLLSCIYLFTQSADSLPLAAYSSNLVFEFVLGIIVYQVYRNKSAIRALILISIILFSLVLAKDFDGRFFYSGIGTALFFYISLYALAKVNLPAYVSVLGGYSYALYLTHPYVIQVFDKVFRWFELSIVYQISALILSLIMVNVLAFLVWQRLEVPMIAYLRRRVLGKKLKLF